MTDIRYAILFLVADARLRDIYVSRFERDGWEVDAASSLIDAERRAVQLRPAILFVDYSFLDGVKAAFKRLRSLPTLLKTRIVVADKYLSREAINEILAAGADDVVMTAHLNLKDLVKRMNNLIEEDL